MTFEVRAARAGDAPALASMEETARERLLDQRGGPQVLGEQAAVGDWSALLARHDVRVFVATVDDVPVGYLQLELPDAEHRSVVTQVFVEPEARELGFGDWMIEAAIEATREAGGTVIESFALPGDRDTKNLFERAGMTARKLIVSKKLA